MQFNKINHIVKPVVIMLVLLFLLVNVNSLYAAKSPGDCEHALAKCLLNAAAFTAANIYAGAAWATFCSIGYQWCKSFY